MILAKSELLKVKLRPERSKNTNPYLQLLRSSHENEVIDSQETCARGCALISHSTALDAAVPPALVGNLWLSVLPHPVRAHREQGASAEQTQPLWREPRDRGTAELPRAEQKLRGRDFIGSRLWKGDPAFIVGNRVWEHCVWFHSSTTGGLIQGKPWSLKG